jgi:hypothetical protein
MALGVAGRRRVVVAGIAGFWWSERWGDSDSVDASGAKGPVYQGCEDIVVWRLSVAGTLELWNGR